MIRSSLRRLLGRRPRPAADPDAALRRKVVAAGGRIPAGRPADVWRPWQNTTLRTGAQVDAAIAEITRVGLVPHHDRPKNWDLLVALGSILDRTSPDACVLEMGAARYSPLLVWLYQLGYRRLHGIDLVWPGVVHRCPITFERGDLTQTSFDPGSFDAIACLSVIEHGVDLDGYLREARRLLRPGGALITSTDYWPDGVDTTGLEAYGGPVRVFDRSSIEGMLDSARSKGFRTESAVDLRSEDRVVRWERMGLDFTFLVFTLVADGDGAPAA